MKHIIIQKLQAELKAFGLNPSHWVVVPSQTRQYRVQNKIDKNFYFRGQIEVKKEKARWKTLELAV